MPVSLTPNPSPACGRGELRETLRVFHANGVLKNVKNLKKSVIPAQAGIQKPLILLTTSHWTPAFAGVTVCFSTPR
jgi:hypothetical protein